MNILYANWSCLGAEDAVNTLNDLGNRIYVIQISEKSHAEIDWNYVDLLGEKVKEYKIDIIFSMNYFPTISEAAYKYKCKYMAWVYDCPSVKVFFPNIINECNYVFIFDSVMYEELRGKGIETVYYMPLAVNTGRLDKMNTELLAEEKYGCDISFVGSLYNESHNFYERLEDKTESSYLMGYLDGIIEAQRKIYGYDLLRPCMNDHIVHEICKAMPYELDEGSFLNQRDIYVDYFLCRRLAYLERERTLTKLSENYKVYLYTYNADIEIGHTVNRGPIDWISKMPYAFRYSKINLNMTLRSIRAGIPMRALDIMGAGGFLLTNYQSDFFRHFEPNQHFVYYGSEEEMLDKVNYYMNHENERIKIARNGHELVRREHNYQIRLSEMIAITLGKA